MLSQRHSTLAFRDLDEEAVHDYIYLSASAAFARKGQIRHVTPLLVSILEQGLANEPQIHLH